MILNHIITQASLIFCFVHCASSIIFYLYYFARATLVSVMFILFFHRLFSSSEARCVIKEENSFPDSWHQLNVFHIIKKKYFIHNPTNLTRLTFQRHIIFFIHNVFTCRNSNIIIYSLHSTWIKKKFKRTRKESLPSNFAHENCDFRDQNLRHGENGDRGRSPRSLKLR